MLDRYLLWTRPGIDAQGYLTLAGDGVFVKVTNNQPYE